MVCCAEDVCVILRESSCTGQPVELSTLLIPIDGSKLRIPNGKVPVAAWPAFVDLAVVRTIHGLQQILLALSGGLDGLKAVLSVFGIVTTCHIKFLVSNVRRNHGLIAHLPLGHFEEIF